MMKIKNACWAMRFYKLRSFWVFRCNIKIVPGNASCCAHRLKLPTRVGEAFNCCFFFQKFLSFKPWHWQFYRPTEFARKAFYINFESDHFTDGRVNSLLSCSFSFFGMQYQHRVANW